jgi:hypothetical protein
MSSSTPEPSATPGPPVPTDASGGPGPTQAEIDAWADQERKRREAWLSGPSPQEREAYAQRERERREAEANGATARAAEMARRGKRYARESQLAAEGAFSLMTRWSRRGFAELMRAGREWEEETTKPGAKRRIRLDDDTP